MEVPAHLPKTLEELRELERAAEREWWWLHGALHAVAQMRAERAAGVLTSYREMQEQARDVDRSRVEIAARIAELEAAVKPLLRNQGRMVPDRVSSEGEADDGHRP